MKLDPTQLAGAAAEAIRSAVVQLEEQLGPEIDNIGSIETLFAWKNQDYRITLQPYIEAAANRNSFKNKPMPNERGPLSFERHFSAEEFDRMRLGFVPQYMDDRWFIYYEPKKHEFRFHRSWTGYCIYLLKVDLEEGGGCHVTESWVNRKPAQFNDSSDSESAAEGLAQLIKLFLSPAENLTE